MPRRVHPAFTPLCIERRKNPMSQTWITVKETNFDLIGIETKAWKETVWEISREGSWIMTDEYYQARPVRRQGQLSAKKLQKLQELVQEVRIWFESAPPEELHQQADDGSVWSLNVQDGKQSFRFSHLYTYNRPAMESLQTFLNHLKRPK